MTSVLAPKHMFTTGFHSHSPLSLPLCHCYLFLGLHVLLQAINTSKARFERVRGRLRSVLLTVVTEMQRLIFRQGFLNLLVFWIKLAVYGCFFLNYKCFCPSNSALFPLLLVYLIYPLVDASISGELPFSTIIEMTIVFIYLFFKL